MCTLLYCILSMIIGIHTYSHTAGLLNPVDLRPHKSFASDRSDSLSKTASESPRITQSDLHHEDTRLPSIIANQTKETPDSSPRTELGNTPPSFSETEKALRLALPDEEHEVGHKDRQEDRAPQLRHAERLESAEESVRELHDYLEKRKSIVSTYISPLAAQMAVSGGLYNARKVSQDYTTTPSPGSASMSPASSATSSYYSSAASSVASSVAPSPQQSPLFGSMSSPSSKGSPSHHSLLHRGLPAHPAPPPLPTGPKRPWPKPNRGSTFISAALASLSPKSSTSTAHQQQEKQ